MITEQLADGGVRARENNVSPGGSRASSMVTRALTVARLELGWESQFVL